MSDFGRLGVGTRRTAHEYVRDSVRQAILSGAIPAGTRLVQTDIASELGVSTTPVREALRDLATEGLIDLDAHRGASVKKFDVSELREIQAITKMLEPEAVRLAAENPPDLDRLTALATAMDSETDIARWVDLNRQFHEGLLESVPNRRLLTMLKGLRDAIAPHIGIALHRHDYRFDLAGEQHRSILDAVRDGDGERAAGLTSEHIDLTTRALESSNGGWET